jgi:predicted nucleotidyltransferase
MRALLAHGGALSVSRLAQETRMTPNGVRRVLADLEGAGVVEALGSGHSRLFRGFPSHPIVKALNALFEAERARFADILATVASAADDETILAVWLFGSVARGDDMIDSDIDIAIVIDAVPSRCDTVADDLRERLREHEARMGFTASIVSMPLSDVRRLARERAPLWAGLVQEAQVLKGVAPERVARAAEQALARSVVAGK